MTSTPVKLQLELAAEKKLKRERKAEERQNKKIKTASKTEEKPRAAKRKLIMSDEVSEEGEALSLHDSDSSTWVESCGEEEVIIGRGCHVIAKIHGEKNDTTQNYVCQVEKVKKAGYEVKFLKKQGLTSRFKVTDEVAYVPEQDIIACLPKAHLDSRTRFKDMLYFDEDLTSYSIYM